MGLTAVFCVAIRVNFCFSHVVPERTFKILVDLSAFPVMIFVCSIKLHCESRVSPRILGFVTVIMMVYLCL